MRIVEILGMNTSLPLAMADWIVLFLALLLLMCPEAYPAHLQFVQVKVGQV